MSAEKRRKFRNGSFCGLEFQENEFVNDSCCFLSKIFHPIDDKYVKFPEKVLYLSRVSFRFTFCSLTCAHVKLCTGKYARSTLVTLRKGRYVVSVEWSGESGRDQKYHPFSNFRR